MVLRQEQASRGEEGVEEDQEEEDREEEDEEEEARRRRRSLMTAPTAMMCQLNDWTVD